MANAAVASTKRAVCVSQGPLTVARGTNVHALIAGRVYLKRRILLIGTDNAEV